MLTRLAACLKNKQHVQGVFELYEQMSRILSLYERRSAGTCVVSIPTHSRSMYDLCDYSDVDISSDIYGFGDKKWENYVKQVCVEACEMLVKREEALKHTDDIVKLN